QRFPNGIQQAGFIQQQIPEYFPKWIQRVTVPKERGTVTHVVCNNLVSLVYLASQACITLHTWLSRADKIEYPDQMIFDLDPAGGGHHADGPWPDGGGDLFCACAHRGARGRAAGLA